MGGGADAPTLCGRGCNDGGRCRAPSPASNAAGATTADRRNGAGVEGRLRAYLIRTNVDIALVGLILACYHAAAYAAESSSHADDGGGGSANDPNGADTGMTEEGELHEEEREAYAVLFPWFAEIVGVFAYYILSRYCHALPYTAIMFVVGAFIGLSVEQLNENAITFSASTWIGIEGEVILLVFLPGLLYLDSFNIDVHLFIMSFWQLITFAFPMVLAGTSLTALVAYYVFNYNWYFDLCMTFGSILAATDPVAVAVLLNELGAPPRLKMHISGESLMNDGSAVVFYNIFSLRFLYKMGIDGVGKDIGWGEGFKLFFRLSLGGACIGVAFGFGLLIVLYNLNRRLSGEDSVVQVVATISTAYLVFFTSEILAHCSGIIAVVFCGVTVKAFGETLYNDTHLSHHFWEITEYLLNTLLFALGGTVWGNIMATKVPSEAESGSKYMFSAEDWGYLFLLFLLVTAIRFFLVFAFYPITARLGIGTNWQEAVFMSWGGLRGAVGIALALSLNAQVEHYTSASDFPEEDALAYREATAKLFAMVGGIAFLTLLINGPTAGPLLKKLGLVTPTECRERVILNYRQHMVQYTLKEYVSLLTEERFQDVDFQVVMSHIPFFKDVDYIKFMAAVKRHKDDSPSQSYRPPNLKNVMPYLYHPEDKGRPARAGDGENEPSRSRPSLLTLNMMRSRRMSVSDIRRSQPNRTTVFDLRARCDEDIVHEERLVFIKLLRSAYYRLVEHGELEARGFIIHSLTQSLDYSEDAASRGLPMADWEALAVASNTWMQPAESLFGKLFNLKQRIRNRTYTIDLDHDFFVVSFKVRQILAFTHAHEWARGVFKREFSKAGENFLTAAEKIVLDECDENLELADEALAKLNPIDVKQIKSHYACQILLNRSAYYFKKLRKHNLMTEREAGELLEEIEQSIFDLLQCREVEHSDELTSEHKVNRLSTLPKDLLLSWGVHDVASRQNLSDVAEETSLVGESMKSKERSFHLSQAEKEELGLDGSDVVVSDNDYHAMNSNIDE